MSVTETIRDLMDGESMELAPHNGFHLEPRCRVCRDPDIRSLANELLALRGIPIILSRDKIHRITYADILRDLTPLSAEGATSDQISYDSLWVHAKRHTTWAG
jgi:hypothetical protein